MEKWCSRILTSVLQFFSLRLVLSKMIATVTLRLHLRRRSWVPRLWESDESPAFSSTTTRKAAGAMWFWCVACWSKCLPTDYSSATACSCPSSSTFLGRPSITTQMQVGNITLWILAISFKFCRDRAYIYHNLLSFNFPSQDFLIPFLQNMHLLFTILLYWLYLMLPHWHWFARPH